MDTDRRNPYLILGLPYGSTADDARKAFARRVRSVRRTQDSIFTVEDLTWALHEIEHATEKAETALTFFRVPANRATLAIPRPGELFAPAAMPMPRRSSPTHSADLDALALDAVREAVARLVASPIQRQVADPYTHFYVEGGPVVPTSL